MKSTPANLQVQHAGCGALGNLAVNPLNQVKIATLGGIDCVLAAMRTHKADTELQRQCCFALMTIADNVAGNQARVTSGGGIALILDAVSAHRSSAPLIKY